VRARTLKDNRRRPARPGERRVWKDGKTHVKLPDGGWAIVKGVGKGKGAGKGQRPAAGADRGLSVAPPPGVKVRQFSPRVLVRAAQIRAAAQKGQGRSYVRTAPGAPDFAAVTRPPSPAGIAERAGKRVVKAAKVRALYAKKGMKGEIEGLSSAERRTWAGMTGAASGKKKEVMSGKRVPKAGKLRQQENKYENLWEKLGESTKAPERRHDWGAAPSLQKTAISVIEHRKAMQASAGQARERAKRRAEQTQRILARQAAARTAPARRPVRG
jgi:hypothetical protein